MSTMITYLELINRSFDRSGWDVVLFQRNLATPGDGEPVHLWHRIRHCGYGNRHPFRFCWDLSVECRDSWGNCTERLSAAASRTFKLIPDGFGTRLVAGEGGRASAVTVSNGLAEGAIAASVYRSDWMLATQQAVHPGQTVRFDFDWGLYLASYRPQENRDVEFARLAASSRRLNLFGIAKASILMLGAGPGPESKPLDFRLDDIVRW